MAANWQLRETTWHHAANFIGLYDATGSGFNSKPTIKKNIQLTITEITPVLAYRILNKGDRIALLLPDHKDLYRQKSKDHLRAEDQAITEDNLKVNNEDLQQPESVITSIVGSIQDSSRFYNPRNFSLDLQKLDVNNPYKNSLALYRNLNAIQVTTAGSVRGNLVFESNQAVAWALISLEIELSDDETIGLKVQANHLGDFVIPLTELPALELDALVTEFPASLRVQLCTIANNKPDPDQVTNTKIKIQSADANGADTFTFDIKFGQHLKLNSGGHQSLVVKT